MIGRVLTRTEIQLYNYLMNERAAVAMAKQITLPDDATLEEIENAVAFALVRAKESVDGHTEIEYVSGQRRDHWRKQ